MATSSKKKGVLPLPSNYVRGNHARTPESTTPKLELHSKSPLKEQASNGNYFVSEEVSNILKFPGHPSTRIQSTVQEALAKVSTRVQDVLKGSFEFSVPLPSDAVKRFGPPSVLTGDLLGGHLEGGGEYRENDFSGEDIDDALRALRGHVSSSQDGED